MKPVCVVAGVGPGNGAAFARRFASEGYAVALLARTTEFTGKLASNALGGFLASKQVIPTMKSAGRGSIVFVGATASRKAGARSASFSSAKGGQRSLAESMARALWPAGIHVALIVVDGVVDLPRTRERMADKPGSLF